MNGDAMTSWHPAQRLQGEMNRLFEEVFGSAFGREWATPSWALGPIGEAAFRGRPMPALNVWEDAESLHVECEVPGLSMEYVEITVSGNELTIRGERKGFEQEGVTVHRREREVGTFSRVLRFPVEIDAERVEARLEQGVLTIDCPKAEHARPRKIEIKELSE